MPYFDHNATTPLADCAREAWLRVQAENWHNPSSPSRAAARARIRLESYHEAMAVLLGGDPAHYVFNSGATEGAHAVLAHWAHQLRPDARIAVSATEHACILAAAGHYFPNRINWLPHESGGLVSPAAIQAAITAGAAGIVVIAANNETGVLQPWPEIATICQRARVPYLCDASQWLGKLPGAGLGSSNAWIIASGHKFGAPKGVGFIKLPKSQPDFHQPGGLQQNGHRAGTEDLAGIAALTAALAQAEQKQVIWESQRAVWRDHFENALISSVKGTEVFGRERERLWNTSLVIVPQGNQTQWILRLDKSDFQISSGAACNTGKEGPSHVLAAVGLPAECAGRALRISSGWHTTEQDWRDLLEILQETGRSISRSH
jgi:cysteine desulfurase